MDAAIAPVLIVGAGIAGLTAAYYLDRSGVPVRIVEASQRIGGRILSRDRALGTETTVELGGEFIDSGHKNIRKLAQELGLVEVDLFTADRQSSINLLLLIGKQTDKIEIFGSSNQRYHLRGGNQQIIEKLADKFRDRIETNTRLESLHSNANGRYRVSLFQGSTSNESTFDRVILALPLNILRSILA